MYAWLISTSTRYGDRHDEPARAVSAQFDGLIAGDRRTGIGLLHLREDPYPVGEIDITQGIGNRSRGGNVYRGVGIQHTRRAKQKRFHVEIGRASWRERVCQDV